jgi:hypothetical protein
VPAGTAKSRIVPVRGRIVALQDRLDEVEAELAKAQAAR